MKRENNHINSMRDDFEKLFFDSALYGSIRDFELAIERYQGMFRDFARNLEQSLKLRLALLWIRMSRGNIDREEAFCELEDIAKSIMSQDEVLDLEYKIVRTTYMILLQNDYSNAKLELEQLSKRLVSPRYNFLYGLVARTLCNVNIMCT